MKKININDIIARKNAQPVVVLTAYTAPQARILDPHVDILLVGDSLGMVLYGMESTLSVTLDMMIAHGKAVAKAASRALVVVDLPFGSYQKSKEQAFETSARVLSETGCTAVKLEGGAEMQETIHFLVTRGIPVMGHVGLKPQSVNAMGGYRTQGKNEKEAALVIADAKAVEQAGAFSMVVEGVVEEVARELTGKLSIPTIGIGASAACDGQVLVAEDMLGLTGDYIPRFVKRYADMESVIEKAVKQYADEVRKRIFPSAEYYYKSNK